VSNLVNGVGAIAAGGSHTCALTTSGSVKCWGSNYSGQLGNGNITNRVTPADVSGLASGVSAIATGGDHSCALTKGGSVKCWGAHSGNGRDDILSGLSSGVSALAAGNGHTCALSGSGGVKCWGYNYYGQLGNGDNTDKLTPVDVVGLTSGVAALAAGSNHTCALTVSGGVKCWGQYYPVGLVYIGPGTPTTPVDVPGLAGGVAAIAAGYLHTCALTTSGGVKCWGLNRYGELGNGSTTDPITPVDVSGLASGVVALAAGGTHSCALTAAHGVKCWGRNDSGQLGDGSTTDRTTPVDVSGLASGVIALSAGYSHTCALTTGGAVKCWGQNDFGQLGDGSTTKRSTPVDVIGLTSGVIALSAGGSNTCALTTVGGMKCWGDGAFGQLGDGTGPYRYTPVDVVLPAGMAAPQTGWWWNPAESGRGFFIEKNAGDRIFFASFLYAYNGRATWGASAPQLSEGSFNGSLDAFAHGQTLTGAYVAPSATVGAMGNLTLTFTDPWHGSIIWAGGTTPIQRFSFADNSNPPAFQPEAGWWWNAAESGRGFSFEVQGSTMFIAGYMYDEIGNPLWYLSTGTLTGQTYQGTWTLYARGQTAPIVLNSAVGPVTITFSSPTAGVMTLPDGRLINITRFVF